MLQKKEEYLLHLVRFDFKCQSMPSTNRSGPDFSRRHGAHFAPIRVGTRTFLGKRANAAVAPPRLFMDMLRRVPNIISLNSSNVQSAKAFTPNVYECMPIDYSSLCFFIDTIAELFVLVRVVVREIFLDQEIVVNKFYLKKLTMSLLEFVPQTSHKRSLKRSLRASDAFNVMLNTTNTKLRRLCFMFVNERIRIQGGFFYYFV